MTAPISLDAAYAALIDNRPHPTPEQVGLADANGRILAAPVHAAVARPPSAVSAMDGYAVRLQDVRHAGAQLKVIGEAPAGQPFTQEVGAQEAVRIFTGGELPAGADHVVIQEVVRREGQQISVEEAYGAAQYVRPRALDFDDGELLLPAGTRLGAPELALIAAANIADINVTRRLRVGLLANGNELKPPGSKLGPGDIVNSNPIGLSARIREWGAIPVDLGLTPDRKSAICEVVQAADDIDVFLPIGGASVGDHDLMRPAFAELGFSPIFERVAVRPGKPTWFSQSDTQFVLGLPGNPASAFVCAFLFLRPWLTGRPNAAVTALLNTDLTANGPRAHFMRANVQAGPDGRLTVTAATNQDSSLIRPMVRANGLIHRPPGAPAAAAHTPISVLLTDPLL